MEYFELKDKLPVGNLGQIKFGLRNIKQLMVLFDNPQDKLPTIHIAGTNGKGSTAIMTANILEHAGYKVGLFTSPSLIHFNERIQINHKPVSDELLLKTVEQIQRRIIGHNLAFSEFELFTCLAWLIFMAESCDVVVLEVGMGGRLDSTNIVKKPIVTAITKIAKDHQAYLGETLSQIAYEKAGILKDQVPLALYPQEPEVTRVIREKAQSLNVTICPVIENQLTFIEIKNKKQRLRYKEHCYELQLLGEHQIYNSAVVLEIIHCLRKKGWKIEEAAVEEGLSDVTWPARFEWIQEDPTVIIDGAHNIDGMEQLARNLEAYCHNKRRIGLIGMLSDKAYDEMLMRIVPFFDYVITVTPQTPRAVEATILRERILALALKQQDQVVAAKDNEEAICLANQLLNSDTMLCVCGSLYMVGYIRDLIQKHGKLKGK